MIDSVKFPWVLSSEEKEADVVLLISEELIKYETGAFNGWDYQTCNDSSLAVYCQNGKALIGLKQTGSNNVTVFVRNAMESYIRIGIQYGLMLALHQECIGLHGVTLLCGNEIIILSAPSGTGKTTLANLLEKYCDAITINGDFALLHPIGNRVIFEPTPFCGSSGRSLNHRFQVNRLVFLEQAKENHWHESYGREAINHFMNNCFLPTWNRNIQEIVRANIMKCIVSLQINTYGFTPTKEAAELFLTKVKSRACTS